MARLEGGEIDPKIVSTGISTCLRAKAHLHGTEAII
jgi:hypothetical protein